MNHHNNLPAVLRSLIVYAVCIPLAVWFGFLVAGNWDRSTYGIWLILALLLSTPFLLRWHHLMMVASLNLVMTMFFLPGAPGAWMPMICLSLGISVLHRTLNSDARFISAPQITWPLIFLVAVIFFTAKMTGGFGMKALGSDVVGGKRYLSLLVSIGGYFALTAQRIPPNRVGLYVALYFLGGCVSAIGDLARVLPKSLDFIFLIFPATTYALDNQDIAAAGATVLPSRFAGLGGMGMAVFMFMMARYGVRGIFSWNRPFRFFLFFLFSTTAMFGGFRVIVLTCLMLFAMQFYFEGLHRTRMLPVFALFGIVLAVLCVPFANKLPYTFQRSLAFLPLNIDPMARLDAQNSQDWRLQIWQAVLPQVPGYLLLGKGYAISQADFATMNNDAFSGGLSAADWGASLAGNYHSGPLSVVIFFGIWGLIAVIWFWIASGRALYNNYRYGDPQLRVINGFLFASLIVNIVVFVFIFGSLYSDMIKFAGIVGLSIAINGGIRRPEPRPVPATNPPAFRPFPQLRPAPGFATARLETQTPHR